MRDLSVIMHHHPIIAGVSCFGGDAYSFLFFSILLFKMLQSLYSGRSTNLIQRRRWWFRQKYLTRYTLLRRILNLYLSFKISHDDDGHYDLIRCRWVGSEVHVLINAGAFRPIWHIIILLPRVLWQVFNVHLIQGVVYKLRELRLTHLYHIGEGFSINQQLDRLINIILLSKRIAYVSRVDLDVVHNSLYPHPICNAWLYDFLFMLSVACLLGLQMHHHPQRNSYSDLGSHQILLRIYYHTSNIPVHLIGDVVVYAWLAHKGSAALTRLWGLSCPSISSTCYLWPQS